MEFSEFYWHYNRCTYGIIEYFRDSNLLNVLTICDIITFSAEPDRCKYDLKSFTLSRNIQTRSEVKHHVPLRFKEIKVDTMSSR